MRVRESGLKATDEVRPNGSRLWLIDSKATARVVPACESSTGACALATQCSAMMTAHSRSSPKACCGRAILVIPILIEELCGTGLGLPGVQGGGIQMSTSRVDFVVIVSPEFEGCNEEVVIRRSHAPVVGVANRNHNVSIVQVALVRHSHFNESQTSGAFRIVDVVDPSLACSSFRIVRIRERRTGVEGLLPGVVIRGSHRPVLDPV